MRTVLGRVAVVLLAAALGVVTACGGDGSGADDGRPTVVVTTSVLGDVVRELVGDDVAVEVIVPAGADPHELAPSPRQAAAMRSADALVVNGGGLEEGLLDTIDAAADDGVPVLAAVDGTSPLPDGERDPHFFTDPLRMAEAAVFLGERLAAVVPELDTAAHRERVATYVATLEALHDEVVEILAAVPPTRRLLVTNHEVAGAFADRYGFEVLGAVVPGGSTLAEPSAADLRDLAELIRERGVPAIFVETSAPARLAEALAAEGAGVDVVELHTEALGEAGSGADTYLGMVRTNAQRIAAALG